jgi:hypothetical protein
MGRGSGEYDRVYYFADFANYFSTFVENGYVPKHQDALSVMANDDMTVSLNIGKLFMDGYMYENTDPLILNIDPADGVLSRIDRISITWSKSKKEICAGVIKGEPSYSPVAKAIRRNADYKDYIVADIEIRAGAIRLIEPLSKAGQGNIRCFFYCLIRQSQHKTRVVNIRRIFMYRI